MGEFYNTLMQAMASSERIFALLDMRSEIADKPDAQLLPRLKGHIVFENVTFGYEPGKPVLHDVWPGDSAGQTCALVGATGSGKSSIVSLLCRFYEFHEGRILADGRDIRSATLESLHKQMGLVLQANYLFSGTVLDNIRYPRPETRSRGHRRRQSADIHDTLLALPQVIRPRRRTRGVASAGCGNWSASTACWCQSQPAPAGRSHLVH